MERVKAAMEKVRVGCKGVHSSPAELLFAVKVALMKVTLLFDSTRAPCPKKLRPEKKESSMAKLPSWITMVAPGSSTALVYWTPAEQKHLPSMALTNLGIHEQDSVL
jgi:hypothetical protein